MPRFHYLERTLPFVIALAFAAVAGCVGGAPQLTSTSSNTQNTGASNGGLQGTLPSTGATTWYVQAGGDHQQGALQALAMLPQTITIDEGDSITWTDVGEHHTITFFGPFNSPQAPPPVPVGPSNPSYDGSTYISSGDLALGKQYTVTFTKAGTYPYVCLFHAPEHKGIVVVQPRGSAYPHPQGYYTGNGNALRNQLTSDAMASVATIPYPVGGTHVAAGVSPPLSNGIPPQSAVFRFLDGNRLNLTSITIAVGTTVTWTNLDFTDPHTVTFPIAGQPLPPLPGEPFTPPIGGSTYDGTQITNSGVLNAGASYSLTFTKAGRFQYLCLFHDGSGMLGTVIAK